MKNYFGDLKTNDKFNNWTLVGLPYREGNQTKALFRCDCGVVKNVVVFNVIKGKSKSCGCGLVKVLKSRHKEKREEEGFNSIKIGDVFNSLTVVSEGFKHKKYYSFECKCVCGSMRIAAYFDLLSGQAQSCVNCARIQTGKNNSRHKENVPAKKRSSLYNRWSSMLKRCYNKNCKSYKNYGARGIGVFCKWKTSFEAFRDWALQNGFDDSLEMDRIDNNEGYFPDNVRFTTRKINSNNRRLTVMITSFGETKSIMEWAQDSRCKISEDELRSRFRAKSSMINNWTSEELMTIKRLPNGIKGKHYKVTLKAFGETKSLFEWSEDSRCKISFILLKNRYYKYYGKSWTPEEIISTESSPKNTNMSRKLS